MKSLLLENCLLMHALVLRGCLVLITVKIDDAKIAIFASFLLGRSPSPITIVGGSRRERCVVGGDGASVVAGGTRASYL